MICPNQPLHCDAYRRFGSAGEPLRWYNSQPAKWEPLIDGIQRLVELRNMLAMRKYGIFLRGDGRGTEFAGKTGRAGDFDAHQVVHTIRAERIEAQTISYMAHLSGYVADVRRKALP